MSKEIILMFHPTFGVLGVLAAVWLLVEVLNATGQNQKRIKSVSILLAICIWLSYLIGGYWYVKYYGADREIIKAGPWPAAHTFFMEAKEHVFFMLLLLSTYLPIAAFALAGNNLAIDRSARYLLMTVATLIVLLGLAMEGAGAVVALGAKVGLLGR